MIYDDVLKQLSIVKMYFENVHSQPAQLNKSQISKIIDTRHHSKMNYMEIPSMLSEKPKAVVVDAWLSEAFFHELSASQLQHIFLKCPY